MAVIPLGELSAMCLQCGGTTFRVPDNATETDVIVCDTCGESVGTVKEYNAEIEQAGKALLPDIADALRKGLKLR